MFIMMGNDMFDFGQNYSILSSSAYDVLSKAYMEVARKRNDFIRSKFVEKGFGDLFDNVGKGRFDRVACVKHEGWKYIYADNGTLNGVFIVAVKDFDFIMDKNETNFSISSYIHFLHQDNFEPEELKIKDFKSKPNA